MLQFSVVKKLRNRLHVKVTGHHFTEAEAAYVEDTLFLNDAIVDVTNAALSVTLSRFRVIAPRSSSASKVSPRNGNVSGRDQSISKTRSAL